MSQLALSIILHLKIQILYLNIYKNIVQARVWLKEINLEEIITTVGSLLEAICCKNCAILTAYLCFKIIEMLHR